MLARILARGLVDLTRQFEPDNDRLFTWWAPWREMRQRNIGWRLDYVLASAPLAARARGIAVAREFGTSDHAPVTAVIDVEPPLSTSTEAEVKPPPPRGQLPLFRFS